MILILGIFILQATSPKYSHSRLIPSVSAATEETHFSEHIDLQFYVRENYDIDVSGTIVLRNTSKKSVSLTLYDMDLPYFVLKDTKIVYVYPTQFLVDMYARNNSMLFTFKSMYTNPVVIPKGGKITITFSAKVKDAYRNAGALRMLTFPFSLESDERTTSVVVTVDKSLPLVFSPDTSNTLANKRVYEISEEKGKMFIFMPQENPIYITISSNSEVPLPPTPYTATCARFEPVTCVNCEDIRYYPDTSQVLATKKSDAEKITVTYAKVFEETCAIPLFNNVVTDIAENSMFVSGFVLSPEGNLLIPAFWRETTNSKNGTKNISNMTTSTNTYAYYDNTGYLTFPLFMCKTDTDCMNQLLSLKTFDTGISTEFSDAHNEYKEATLRDINARIIQQSNNFSILINNTTDSFISLGNIKLKENSMFSLLDSTSRIIPPKKSISIPLINKTIIQTSNQPVDIFLEFNKQEKTITFKPITILILTIIEILSYIFVVSMGIAILSVIGIILYNKKYEKKNL